MSDRELEDLQSLVHHPGYLRFLGHVRAEIKHMMGHQLETVANDTNDAMRRGSCGRSSRPRRRWNSCSRGRRTGSRRCSIHVAAEQQPQTMSRGGV
jgi:hypothetical protein